MRMKKVFIILSASLLSQIALAQSEFFDCKSFREYANGQGRREIEIELGLTTYQNKVETTWYDYKMKFFEYGYSQHEPRYIFTAVNFAHHYYMKTTLVGNKLHISYSVSSETPDALDLDMTTLKGTLRTSYVQERQVVNPISCVRQTSH
jgi:hypothetical protein